MNYKHDTQVGGTHYDQGEKPQHWDLATMYGWDPFQYQITKYVMRWKDKHPDPAKKLEDLKKARSFLDKYIQDYEAWLPRVTPVLALQPPIQPHQVSTPHWQNEGYYGNMECLWSCRKCKATVRAINAPQEPHACAAQASPQASP